MGRGPVPSDRQARPTGGTTTVVVVAIIDADEVKDVAAVVVA